MSIFFAILLIVGAGISSWEVWKEKTHKFRKLAFVCSFSGSMYFVIKGILNII